jgi:hypothetical protein
MLCIKALISQGFFFFKYDFLLGYLIVKFGKTRVTNAR